MCVDHKECIKMLQLLFLLTMANIINVWSIWRPLSNITNMTPEHGSVSSAPTDLQYLLTLDMRAAGQTSIFIE